MSDPDGPQIDPDDWDTDALGAILGMDMSDVLPHVIPIGDYFLFLLGDGPPPAPVVEAIESVCPPLRTPIQKLLEAFELEEERDQAAAVAHWNDSDARQDIHDDALAAQQAVETAQASASSSTPPTTADTLSAAALSAADAALGAVAKATDTITPPVDADVHVSASAPIFANWHIGADKLREDFDQPLRVPITDQGILDAIASARAMLPVVEQGSAAKGEKGKLLKMNYPVRGPDAHGWMFDEPLNSDYDTWLAQRYDVADKALAAAMADPTTSPSDRAKCLDEQRLIATVIATRKQEGAPSAINTYDKTVLTWGTGFAAAGKLREVFYEITKNPRVRKALYLCGFLFEGTLVGNDVFCAYQIVDLPNKCVVFRDDWRHRDVPPSVKKGDIDRRAFTVLKIMVDQIEMLYLLVQLARDPLTMGVIFEPFYQKLRPMLHVDAGNEILTQACYVFAGQVRHNWGLGPDIVSWAISHFSADEQLLPSPSIERDAAIAKGICRRVMQQIQKQRWTNAVAQLKKQGGPVALSNMPAGTEWGVDRLIDNYWTTLKKGTNTQDGSKVAVKEPTDYLSPLQGPPIGDRYVVLGKRGQYDIGALSQCDLLFDTDDVQLVRFEDGNVVISERGGAQRTVTVAGAGVP
jgi:hypothetical protein